MGLKHFNKQIKKDGSNLSATRWARSLCFSLLFAAGANLNADSLPLGVTAAAVAVDDTTGQVCSQSGVSSASCSVGGSTATAIVNNGQGGSASVTLGGTATAGAAITEYYFGLVGPTTESVPIIINGYANTQDSGSLAGLSYAVYYIYQASQSGASYVADFFGSPTLCQYYSFEGYSCLSTGTFKLNTTVMSNSLLFVFFEAVAGGTNASAIIDPTISIDPTFADASQFTIQANPGVFTPATPAAAPEPGTAGLLAFSLIAMSLGAKKTSQRIRRTAHGRRA